MKFLSVSLMIAALAACGGEDAPKNAPPPPATPAGTPAAPAPGAPAAGSGSGKPLSIMLHAEDHVVCPAPRTGSPKCDPNARKPVQIGNAAVQRKPEDLWCNDGEVCQNTSDSGWVCGPCPERFAIRHEFKDRDFASDNNRDPFASAIGGRSNTGTGSAGDVPKDSTSKCVRAEQMRVGNYGWQDLKLVGIVSQGTQRKVLLMDPGNYGHIIRRGDCVGKEKAWVKDIGENFICFEMNNDNAPAGRLPEGQCIELHTKQIQVTNIPNDSPDPSRISTQPILPPTTTPEKPGPTRGAGSGSAAPAPGPTQPQQPPTVIKP